MGGVHLSIIVPAYNEAGRISDTLKDIDARLRDVPFVYEIIVVDDGSSDGTGDVVNGMMGRIRNLRLTGYKQNRGKGHAVKEGMLSATGEIRLFMDADNSTSIDHFTGMIPEFESGADIVICSRAHRKSNLEPPQPLLRRLLGKAGNLLMQAMLLPGFWDTQCGFKAFTDRAVERIFPLVQSPGWVFDVEVLALARKLGLRIREIPVLWRDDARSHVRPGAYLRVLWEIFGIRRRIRRDFGGGGGGR